MLEKLYFKYKNLPKPVKASFWFLICSFLQKGISMLTTPIFTRIMTEAEFGRYSIFSSWDSILIIFASLELASGVYTKGLVSNEEDADAFSSSLLSLSTVSIAAFSVLFLVFHKLFNQLTGLSTYLMVMMLIEMWATVSYQFWSNRERVAYRYKGLFALTLTFSVLRPVCAAIAVYLSDDNHQVEARITAATVVNVLLFIWLFISILKKGKVFYHKQYWKYALTFNLPLIPHYLSQIILNQSDKIMIGKMCDASAVGYYTVAYSIAMVMQIFNTSISATMNPWIYRSIKNRSYDRIGDISYNILAVIACLNFMVCALAPEFLRIMAPKSYSDAIWSIPPVTASVYFMFLYNLFATFEYYFNKTKWVMCVSVICALSNILLNAIFIPKFGYIAAGYTTLACYIFFAALHYICMKKVCKEYMDGAKIYSVGKIILIGGVLVGSTAIMLLLYNQILIRYIILAVLVVIAVCFRKRIINVFSKLKN